MLKWLDVLKFANYGSPEPTQRIEKTDAEWKGLLTEDQYRITRLKGTERAYSSEMCELFEPGKYACTCCGTLLFDAEEKFESGSGWPSFTQPAEESAIAYHKDMSHGMQRVEVTCNSCDAHLGHIFPDGPAPSGLRYCINAVSLKKVEATEHKVILGGGCFWCTEAVFQRLEGVSQVRSGYSGGKNKNPTYREVVSGLSGHAEVIEITYNPSEVSYEDIVIIHLTTHDPTTLNQQGADRGTQYRSVVFYKSEEEKRAAERAIAKVQPSLDDPIVTELAAFEAFYKAEAAHQDFYNSNPQQPYCHFVIDPKLEKFRMLYQDRMKQA